MKFKMKKVTHSGFDNCSLTTGLDSWLLKKVFPRQERVTDVTAGVSPVLQVTPDQWKTLEAMIRGTKGS